MAAAAPLLDHNDSGALYIIDVSDDAKGRAARSTPLIEEPDAAGVLEGALS